MLRIACLAAAAAVVEAAAARETMVYLYCMNETSCAERVDKAVAKAVNITHVVVGSHNCRMTDWKRQTQGGGEWCDYDQYLPQIQKLQKAGIKVMINAAGASNLASNPFYTGGNGMERLVALAKKTGAVGWAFDLESHKLTLDDYAGFLTKVGHALKPLGLKIQYTCARGFTPSMEYSTLLPLVDYVFDMGTYRGMPSRFDGAWALVPAGLEARYVPGSSTAKWTQDTAATFLAKYNAHAAQGLTTAGLFVLDTSTEDWWFAFLGQWLHGA
eukprot:TRINITY_DN17769_c1_g1_i1.p1 TRINITY_DN17769_c1_g1~~TRINITY_DN17769_c1_g1_i1.p1  ORF type:complete len:271 (+),score=93.09 TRINITY_DN17769_c1_g1_i1:37-849(+)